jgi:FkbM family methyltransferase
VRVPGSSTDVYLRPGTTDVTVFDEVFLQRSYDVSLAERPCFIVDAGANIGLTSVFFAMRYPDATIVSIEPEAGNFEILLRNTRQLRRVQPIKAGLWSGTASLGIRNPGAEVWGFQVYELSEGGGIPAIGVSDILSRFRVPFIDVLKIDIEGAEIEVLNSSPSWIDRVGTLIIELHDRHRPGCTETLESALAGQPFVRSTSADCLVFTRLDGISRV